MDLVEVKSLDEIESPINGHYWSFPEFIWTFGNGLKGAKLVRAITKNSAVYFRKRQTSATLINWQGGYTEEDLREVFDGMKELGISSFSFNPTDKNLPVDNWYWTTVWKSYASLIDNSDSTNRRWQMRRALGSLDFSPMEQKDLPEALECLRIWRYESERRHGNINTAFHLQGLPYDKNNNEFAWVMGYGHYVYSTEHHFDIPNSVFFVGRDKEDGHVAGVVGGWVNGKYANCMIVKHDFSSKWNIQALWAKWTEHVHNDLGCIQSDNGTTSDIIKERLGMTKFRAYKPVKYKA